MGDLAAIVLAAGGSARLGRPKQLLVIDGDSLLARASQSAVAAGCDPVIVVLGRDAEACAGQLPPASTVIINDEWESGMGSSLRAGARALPSSVSRTFILLCDQPMVTAETLRCLLDRFESASPDACVSAYAGTCGPPVLVNAGLIDLLREWPEREGAKRLWTAPSHRVISVDVPEAAIDIDTSDDVIRHLKPLLPPAAL